jgi:hypothetical protein
MNVTCERKDGNETITLSSRPSVVSLVMVVMGVLVMLQVALVLTTRQLAIPLMVILVVAAVSAGWLSLNVLESALPVSIRLDKSGITLARLLGDLTIPWSDFVGAKLVPTSGSLSENAAAAPSGHLAIGLFLKSRKIPRAHDLDADIVVGGAPATQADSLLRVVDRITDYRAAAHTGAMLGGRRGRKAAPVVQATPFRRKRESA